MADDDSAPIDPWTLLRFAIVSPLLASPPKRGELGKSLRRIAGETFKHPVTGEPLRFGFSTIERWYYLVRDADNPIEVLRRSVRKDRGRTKAFSQDLLRALELQYKAHPSWSYKLHADNLRVLVEEQPALGPAPSYQSVRRRMRQRGWLKRRKARTRGQKKAAERLARLETRSFEATHVHALWHLDFHEASRRVLGADGKWLTPVACAALDDHSRLVCHVQWYPVESAETLFHCLSQAFLKRGLPRKLMTDNGGAMLAAETVNGLALSGIEHATTLAYSPHQNGKQERFWGTLEGRMLKLLENVEPLSLEFLNRFTLAWLESEYHKEPHEEIGLPPMEQALRGASAGRSSPKIAELRFRFSASGSRRQRRGDGTVSIEGIRFEIPSRFRTLDRLHVRYRRWDLTMAWIVDPRTKSKIATIRPLDKHKNADARRRSVDPIGPVEEIGDEADEPLPPLARKILRDFAATGRPPAYLPFNSDKDREKP